MLVIVMAAMLIVLMVMLVIVTAAMLIVLVVMLVIVMAAMLIVLMVMLVVVVVVVVAAMLMAMMLCGFYHGFQFVMQAVAMLDGLSNLLAVQLVPRGSDQKSVGIVLPQKGNGGVQLVLGNVGGTAEQNGRGGFDLILIKFAKVLQIDLAFGSIGNGDIGTQTHFVCGDTLHSTDDIGELAHAGRLDEDAVGMIVSNDLRQCFAEIAHQRTADTAGVHFVDLNSSLLHKAAVNADFAKFVFNQHDLLALIGFFDHLFDERGLSGTQKAGVNVNDSHINVFPFKISHILYHSCAEGARVLFDFLRKGKIGCIFGKNAVRYYDVRRG